MAGDRSTRPSISRSRKVRESPGLFDEIEASQHPPVQPPAGIPHDWKEVLAAEFSQPYFRRLLDFVAVERARHQVLPSEDDVFNALAYTPFDKLRVLLLGQDPYPTPGNAHGLAFSVLPGVALPGSLRNMIRELQDDIGGKTPNNGYLVPWAKQGVMLLNAVLTVRANEPNSHQGMGWEQFTDAVIRRIAERPKPVVFLLWGAYAQKKAALIDTSRHIVLKAAHPSPLSANNGFFGCKAFSKANEALRASGQPAIDWQLPDI
jgi:uracil-DNA glycosylase